MLPGQTVRWQTVWCLLYVLLYLQTFTTTHHSHRSMTSKIICDVLLKLSDVFCISKKKIENQCIDVPLPVVWTQRRVWRRTLGTFPAHEIPLKLFDCLQGFPLAGKRLHMASWGQQQREGGVREWQVGWKLEAGVSERRKIRGKSVESAWVENFYARRMARWKPFCGSSPLAVQRKQNSYHQLIYIFC